MSKLTEFYEYIKGKRVSVVGIGISNTPLIDFLLSHGAVVTARDMKPAEKLGTVASELENKGVRLILGEKYLENLDDEIIFRAPGIRPDIPEFKKAVENGSTLTSEMELFFELCPCKIFGITGSDGKTTTTTLTYMFLRLEAEKRHSGKTVYVGGNIGTPLLPIVDKIKPTDYAVVELSSFQLQNMKRSPFAAAITNVTPNHLNWHTGMEEYTLAKENIFRNPGNERLVLNWGCDATREMAELTRADVTFFSAKSEPELRKALYAIYEKDGGIEDDEIVRKNAWGEETLLKISDIKLPGRHNVENYMTAIGLTWGFVGKDVIREVAKTFGGVEHRCEFVREFDGVKYYNSSIDSSPTRTEAALRAFHQKVIVICGGYDKHIPYEPLAKPLIDCAKAVILTGDTAPKIKSALISSPEYKGEPPVYESDTFEGAVELSKKIAQSGDIVILSPASASFDRFKNFEERGRYFKKLVNEF